MKKYFIAIGLVSLSVFFRTFWHLGPNIEFVTTASLLAGIYLGGVWALVVPLVSLVVSDTILGNSNIFLFTWSAYFIIGLTAMFSGKKIGKNKLFGGTVFGVGASLWFFAWTNFGVWFLDSWGMYPKTLSGLIQAYIMGIPFLKNNLIGNAIFIPVSLTIIEKARNCIFVKKLFNNLKKYFLFNKNLP